MTEDSDWTGRLIRQLEKKSGSLDDLIKIKALPGEVELVIASSLGNITLTIPSEGIDHLIERLASARDAAALMKSTK